MAAIAASFLFFTNAIIDICLTLPGGSVVGTEFLGSLFVLPDTFAFLPDLEFGLEAIQVSSLQDLGHVFGI